MRNKYVKCCRIPEKKCRPLVKLFSLDLNAVLISQLSPLNRNIINRYLTAMRTPIAEFYELEFPFRGEAETDENYFRVRRIKVNAAEAPVVSKTIVFGIFNRNGKV